MTIADRLNKDFLAAFKAKETTKKNFLGVIKGEIQSLAGKGKMPSDENVLPIIKKMEKSLKASIEQGDKVAEAELEFLKPYLPEQMSEDQIREIIEGYVQGGAGNIGQIMGMFNKDHKGKADNRLVSSIAKELLNEMA